mmetsp:Transcript_28162/g.39827  ORF Transcript_28162/g.39827 Transcript_28162/m.39827 type:complete len:208 (-) Transcript_28162:1548-2171(-)
MFFNFCADEISFIASTSSSSNASQSSASSSRLPSLRRTFKSSSLPPSLSSSFPDAVKRAGKTASRPFVGRPLGKDEHIAAQCLGRSPGDLKRQSILPFPLSTKPTRSIPRRRAQACRCIVFNFCCKRAGSGPYSCFHLFVSSTSCAELSARRAEVSCFLRSSSSDIISGGILNAWLDPSEPLTSILPSPPGRRIFVRGTNGRSRPRS